MPLARKIVALSAMLVCSAGAGAAVPDWSLDRFSGAVTVEIDGVVQQVGPGAAVPAGAILATGRDGSVTLVRGGDRLVLDADSRLRVAHASASRGLVQFVAERGTAYVDGAAGNALAVSTRHIVAIANAASYRVSVTDAGSSVEAKKGSVRVVSKDGLSSRSIGTGSIAQIDGPGAKAMIVRSSWTASDASAAPKIAYSAGF